MERFSATPRQADLMMMWRAGQPEDGPCAATLRPDGRAQMGAGDGCLRLQWRNVQQPYAVVQGVDHIVPVDIYCFRLPAATGDAAARNPWLCTPRLAMPLGVHRAKSRGSR